MIFDPLKFNVQYSHIEKSFNKTNELKWTEALSCCCVLKELKVFSLGQGHLCLKDQSPVGGLGSHLLKDSSSKEAVLESCATASCLFKLHE